MEQQFDNPVLALTAQIVSAHLSNNRVASEGLPALIQSVYQSLSSTGKVTEAAAERIPAVPVKKSVFPDYIVCLEDGKKLKMLKRHLATAYGLTPDQYREKWGLSRDYPMVAPNYAEKRSALAKTIGLGRKPAEQPVPITRGKPVRATPTLVVPEPEPEPDDHEEEMAKLAADEEGADAGGDAADNIDTEATEEGQPLFRSPDPLTRASPKSGRKPVAKAKPVIKGRAATTNKRR